MSRISFAALALACACSPVFAAEAAEAVTWGALGAIGLGALAIGGLVIVALVVGGIILKAWSH